MSVICGILKENSIMNSIKIAVLFCFGLGAVVVACQPSVVFKEAQPKDVEQRPAFDPHYQGVFYCSSDSTWVFLTSTTLYKEKLFSLSLDKSDPEQDIEEVEKLGHHVTIDYEDDSTMLYTVTLRDTLFSMSPQHVLKYYRGHYILNRQLSEGNWEVKTLLMDDGGNLSLSETKLPQDLSVLEEITPVEDISTERQEQIRIDPTRIAFKKLLRTRLIFEECDYFERVLARMPM